VEIEKTFLVLASNENGTVEMSDVRLILPPLVIWLKHDFCCIDLKECCYLFVYIN